MNERSTSVLLATTGQDVQEFNCVRHQIIQPVARQVHEQRHSHRKSYKVPAFLGALVEQVENSVQLLGGTPGNSASHGSIHTNIVKYRKNEPM